MREFPVFLPHGEDHVALTLAVPDQAPSGLVLLLTGGAAARGHRFQLWTRTARALADEGLASVRLDYLGTGESTGELPEWHINDIPIDQATAVVRFAMSATGTSRLAVVGNCIGARIALEVAAVFPECASAVCIRTPVLQPTHLADALVQARRWKVAKTIRSNPILRRLVVEPVARAKRRPSGRVQSLLGKALDHATLLFLYSEEDFTYGERVRKELFRMLSGVPQSKRGRFELRVLSGRGLKGFESIDIQHEIIDAVVDASVQALCSSPRGVAHRR